MNLDGGKVLSDKEESSLKVILLFGGVGVCLMGLVIVYLIHAGFLPGRDGKLILMGAGLVIGVGVSVSLSYALRTREEVTDRPDKTEYEGMGEMPFWVQGVSYLGMTISVAAVVSFFLGYLTFLGMEMIAVAGFLPSMVTQAYQRLLSDNSG